MAINVDESTRKYKEYIDSVRKFHNSIISYGYSIKSQDDFELGASYKILYKGSDVALLDWNVPSYLTFETYVDQKEKSFTVDYVKNIKDWNSFLESVEGSLKAWIESKT